MTARRQTARDALRQVVTHVEEHVQWMKEEGARDVEATPDTVRGLRAGAKSRTAPASRASATAAAPATKPAARATAPAVSAATPLDAIAARIAACRLCRLCETRNNTVPGQGSTRPELMFIGEGPGADEDAQGLAFVGRAGQLLTKIINAMGFEREEVWIGNIVKCRPPNNRVPSPDEMQACLPYLREQIALLKPKIIVCLGATAVKGLFDTQTGITKLRGQWMTFEGIDTMPTYHPAYLLRNPPAKREVWEDMKDVLRKLGRPVPQSK